MWEGGWASLKVLILCQESICSRGPFCSFFLKGDKTKSNFCFSHNNLTELRFTSGDLQFPSPAFTPDYTNDNFGREYGSLFSPSGAIGISFKSDWGLARITEDTYKDNMCLYRTSFLRNVVHSMEYDQTHLEPRMMCPSLDCHFKFKEKPTSNLGFVVMAIYDDSYQIMKDDTSSRSVVINFPLWL